jgi:probable DNA metabolism protein
MTTLIYDGTFEGLLSTVFEIYDRKLQHIKLHKGESRNTALFEDVVQVTTDQSRYERVLSGLKKKISSSGINRLYAAYLSEIKSSDEIIVRYIRHALDNDRNIEADYGNRFVLRVEEIVRMVKRERHRMEAFIRFQKLKDEIFFATIEPDFNVIPLLIKHFKDRYADQRWIIYDLKRKYGIYYDLKEVEYIELDFSSANYKGKQTSVHFEDEGLYQHLWKNYFNSINIASRKNTKLHLRHIPKRYWKHLTEKI